MQNGWHQVVIVSLIVALGALGLLEVVADRLLVQEPLAGMASIDDPVEAWQPAPSPAQHPVLRDDRGGAVAVPVGGRARGPGD